MNTLRLLIRTAWFVVELFGFLLDFLWRFAKSGGRLSQKERSRWLQRSARRTLAVFGVTTTHAGVLPQRGMFVSNHLSYLDILVLVALMPAVFVSKSEVKRWPVFGWFAARAGTLFVDRSKRSDVTRMNAEIEARLGDGDVLVLFPEGTSWNGDEVLPFKSSLLEPIIGTRHPLTVGHIRYALDEGSVRDEVCYWGDATFFPHLVRLMRRSHIHATVRFESVPEPAQDRKVLAQQLHDKVVEIGARDVGDNRMAQ